MSELNTEKCISPVFWMQFSFLEQFSVKKLPNGNIQMK